MACVSGCCKPAQENVASSSASSPQAIFSGGSTATESQSSPADTVQLHATGPVDNQIPTASSEKCCGPVSQVTIKRADQEDGCQKDCCSSKATLQKASEEVSACCEGKASPCCDTSCIDRIARRSCAEKKGKLSNTAILGSRVNCF